MKSFFKKILTMKNKLTIFNTCVEVTSQEQANRLKQVCIDNGLPIWKDPISFDFNETFGCEFYFTIDPDSESNRYAFVVLFSFENHTKVTESEWLELLKQYNDEINS